MELLIYCLLHYKQVPFYPAYKLKLLLSILAYFVIAIFFNCFVKGIYFYLLVFIEVSFFIYFLSLIYRVRDQYYFVKEHLLKNIEYGALSIDEFNYVSDLIKTRINLNTDRSVKAIVRQIGIYQNYKNF